MYFRIYIYIYFQKMLECNVKVKVVWSILCLLLFLFWKNKIKNKKICRTKLLGFYFYYYYYRVEWGWTRELHYTTNKHLGTCINPILHPDDPIDYIWFLIHLGTYKFYIGRLEQLTSLMRKSKEFLAFSTY
jgi:hypothetical protein